VIAEEIAMLDVTKAQVVHDWTYERPLLACRFDPQSRYVICSAENNLLQRFSLADGSVQPLAPIHDSWVQALAVTPDGNLAVSGGGDGRLVWWDMREPNVTSVRTVLGHSDYVRSVSISGNGKWLVSGGYDRAIHLWRVDSGELVRSWTTHEMNVYSVQFFPDQRRFVSGDLKGVVYLWDIDSSEPLAKFDGSALHSFNDGQKVNFGGVRTLATNSEMTQLAAGGLHKSSNPLGAVHEPLALRFALDNQTLLRSHVAEGIPGGGLWRLVYLSDGTLMGMTGGSTGGLLLFWNGEQDLTFHKFQLPALARDMDLSSDGLLVATAHYDRHLRITRLAA
jgi:WD40 repeat protein